MNLIKKNEYLFLKNFKLIFIIFYMLAFVISCIGCSKTVKVVEPTATNDLDNQNDIISMLKNKKCTNEHKEEVREIDFDSVFFGSYEQDGIVENGKEDIEWIILDKNFEKNEVLLISKYSIDYVDFVEDFNNLTEQQKDDFLNEYPNKDMIDLIKMGGAFALFEYRRYCNYEQTNLHKYLNNFFYQEAFNDKEKKFLLDNNQVIRGNEYNKRVMLPTEEVLSKYFFK